jgi:HlyD family secretion protein
MDIPRPNAFKEKRKRSILIGAGVLAVVLLITLGVSQLKPAAPGVERSTVWLDTVKRGSMLRQVRGLGVLVPEEIRLIPAMTEGRVEKILARPGTAVKADTVLVELSNPQIEQAAIEAQMQLRAAEANYRSVQVQRQSAVLNQKAEAARIGAEYNEARMRAQTDAELAKLGVISDLNKNVSQGTAQQLATRSEIEVQRLDNAQREQEAFLAAERARVEQSRAQWELARTRLESLKIRAGSDGVLQELSLSGQTLQLGAQVPAGTTIARVSNPSRLKAELRINETQVRDVRLGLPAQIDTRNGIIKGTVTRIDPASQNGTVAVDVTLEGELPPGARPELSVDGTIDLEKLENILYVGRPAFGQEGSTVGMFRLEPDGSTASRVPVKLGRSSVNTIEIQQGLKEGDQVILSDMSRWDNFDRVRLE